MAVNPEDFGATPVQAAINPENFGAVRVADHPTEEVKPQEGAEPTIWNSLVSGYQQSATGLLARGKLPDITLDRTHMPWYDKTLESLSSTISDIPEMIGGSILGSAVGRLFGPAGARIGAGAGAFAVPTEIRESLIKAYQNGDATTGADFLSRVGIAIKGLTDKEVMAATAKSAAIGAFTIGAGGLAARGLGGEFVAGATEAGKVAAARTAAEVGTMAVAPAALQGRLPDAQDFVNAAILVGGMKVAGHVAGRIANLYAKGNIEPAQVVADAKENPEIAKELAAPGDPTEVPKAYQPIVNAQEASDAFSGESARQVLDSPFADIPEAKLPYQVNLKYIEGPDSLKQLITSMSEKYQDDINVQRGGVQSHADTELKATQQLNDLTGGLADKIVTGRQPGTAANAVELKVRGDLLMQSTVEAGAAIKAYNEAKAAGTATDQMKLDALNSIHKSAMLQAEFTGAAAEVGRALEYMKRIKELRTQSKRIQELTEAYHGDPDKLLDLAGEITTPEGMAKFAAEANKATTYDKFIEAWKAGILSGPIANMANIAGNGTFMTMRPLVDLAAVPISRVSGGEPIPMVEPFARAFGNLQGAKDAILASGKAVQAAYKEGGLKGAAAEIGIEKPGGTAKAEHFQGAIGGVKGHIVRLPFRALSLADDFFKTMNDYGERYAISTRQAVKEGYNPNTREFRERVLDLVHNNPEIAEQGHDAALRFTFNKPLGEKGQAIQRLVHTAKLDLVVPFIRTPVNIFKEMMRMTPFAPIVKEWRDAYSAGGARRAQAISEMAMGTAASAVIASYVKDGSITGQSDPDPRKRAAQLASGWQPYSIKIGNKYYSYQRLQPLGTLIGMAADITQVYEHMTDEESNKTATMLSVAFANAVTNQTFLAGITNIVQVMADPNRYGPQFVQQYAGSVVPALVAQSTQMYDPIQRETNSIVDAVKARIPGLRQTLEPRINPLTGEPLKVVENVAGIMPIREREVSSDPVLSEAVRLGVGVSKAPKSIQLPAMGQRDIGKVQLTPEQRRIFSTASGEFIHETMSNIVNTPMWESTPDLIKAQIFQDVIKDGRALGRIRAVTPEQRMDKMQEIIQKVAERMQGG